MIRPAAFVGTALIYVMSACGCGTSASTQSNNQNRDTKQEVLTAMNDPSSIPKKIQHAGTYAGQWSEPVNGLSARLVVTLQESPNSPRFAAGPVTLEVKNTYSTPLAFIDQPSFADKATWDANGNALPESFHAGNHLTGNPQWAVIPGNAYLGIRVDTSIPVEVGLCFGVLAPDTQSLSATLVAKHREGPENQWVGEIQLPPVALGEGVAVE
jgi:hypothetical protein